MNRLERLRPYPVSTFAGVTLLIWGNRVWLAWTNPKLDVADKLVYSVPITAFVMAASGTLGLQLAGRSRSRGFRTLVDVFAGGTVVYWAIRLPIILSHDHPVGFKVVHSVLGVGSAGLALRAWRAVRHPAADRVVVPVGSMSA